MVTPQIGMLVVGTSRVVELGALGRDILCMRCHFKLRGQLLQMSGLSDAIHLQNGIRAGAVRVHGM